MDSDSQHTATVAMPLFFAGLLLAAATAAHAFPDRFSAAYELRTSGAKVGETHWTLAPTTDGRFIYQTESTTTGIISLFRNSRRLERSEWRYHEDAIQPLAYRYSRRRGDKLREVQIAFDWKAGVARNTVKGESWQMPLPAKTLDKHVYMLALMQDLSVGKTNIEYLVADGGRIKTYILKVAGEESIDTPLGHLDTIRVRRIRKDTTRQTTLWCAPGFQYLPVKMEHREKDGSVIILLVESVEGIGMRQ